MQVTKAITPLQCVPSRKWFYRYIQLLWSLMCHLVIRGWWLLIDFSFRNLPNHLLKLLHSLLAITTSCSTKCHIIIMMMMR